MLLHDIHGYKQSDLEHLTGPAMTFQQASLVSIASSPVSYCAAGLRSTYDTACVRRQRLVIALKCFFTRVMTTSKHIQSIRLVLHRSINHVHSHFHAVYESHSHQQSDSSHTTGPTQTSQPSSLSLPHSSPQSYHPASTSALPRWPARVMNTQKCLPGNVIVATYGRQSLRFTMR